MKSRAEIAELLAEHFVLMPTGPRGFLDKLESLGLRVIEDQPDHFVDFREEGWQIQHSVECRIQGKLLDCDLHQAVVIDCIRAPRGEMPEFLTRGRYKLTFNEQGETHYERVEDDPVAEPTA